MRTLSTKEFNDYIVAVHQYQQKYTTHRFGQCLFNVLFEMHRDIADSVKEISMGLYDPFYILDPKDTRISDFLDIITGVKELPAPKPITFQEAFDKFIKHQEVIAPVMYYDRYIEGKDVGYRGAGILLGNHYALLSYGGGCSGEDCNTQYIVDPDNKLVAQQDF